MDKRLFLIIFAVVVTLATILEWTNPSVEIAEAEATYFKNAPKQEPATPYLGDYDYIINLTQNRLIVIDATDGRVLYSRDLDEPTEPTEILIKDNE